MKMRKICSLLTLFLVTVAYSKKLPFGARIGVKRVRAKSTAAPFLIDWTGGFLRNEKSLGYLPPPADDNQDKIDEESPAVNPNPFPFDSNEPTFNPNPENGIITDVNPILTVTTETPVEENPVINPIYTPEDPIVNIEFVSETPTIIDSEPETPIVNPIYTPEDPLVTIEVPQSDPFPEINPTFVPDSPVLPPSTEILTDVNTIFIPSDVAISNTIIGFSFIVANNFDNIPFTPVLDGATIISTNNFDIPFTPVINNILPTSTEFNNQPFTSVQTITTDNINDDGAPCSIVTETVFDQIEETSCSVVDRIICDPAPGAVGDCVVTQEDICQVGII